MERSLADLIGALRSLGDSPDDELPEAHARPDVNRERRNGIPEIILAAKKSPEQVTAIVAAFLERTGRAIVSRADKSLIDALCATFPEYEAEPHPSAGMLVLRRPGYPRRTTGGKIGIITAGTSDMPVAEQAAVIAREMGCDVIIASDVGVAGIHRLFRPLHQMLRAPVDVIVVAAGMDGALPSVVAGLVDVPVIGLPTSTGYGLGGEGVAALLSMLQTCAPGLVVVNVDNGIGAGSTAALIANRIARARERTSPPLAADAAVDTQA